MAAKPNAPLQTLTENQKLFLHDLSYLDRSALLKRTIKSVKTKKCAINATSPICMRSQSSSSSNIKTPLVPNKSRLKSITFNANSVKLQKISDVYTKIQFGIGIVMMIFVLIIFMALSDKK